MTELPPNLRHRLILARTLDRVGLDDRGLRRRRESGELVQVRRGCYMRRTEWEALDRRERHIARAQAIASNASIEPVFSHLTAAALQQIPVVESLEGRVHVTVAPGAAGRRQVDISIHALPLELEQLARVDGLLVTDPARTVVDLALSSSFQNSIVPVDWAVQNGLSRADLHSVLDLRNPVKRRRAAEATIDFGDRRSGSPGESVSRGVMHLLGVEPPLLQVPIKDGGGVIGVVDFFWPEVRVIGEFDGKAKYLRHEFIHGRDPGEVVFDEKLREDRMRATGCTFVRWGSADIRDPDRLASLLRGAGVPGLR